MNKIVTFLLVLISVFACEPKPDVRTPLGYYFDIGEYHLNEITLTLDSIHIDGRLSRQPKLLLLEGEAYEFVFFGSFTVNKTGINYSYADTVSAIGGDPKPTIIKVVEGRK